MSNYNRTKGHDFERQIASDFRDLGFPKAKTSRQTSRLADDCKIDITGVFPFAPQCKNTQRYASAKEVLNVEWLKYCMGTDGMEDKKMVPILLAKAVAQPTMVTLLWEDFKPILEIYLKHKDAK